MSFESKFPSRCAECSEGIETGDLIVIVDGKPVHEECDESPTTFAPSRSSGGPVFSSLGSSKGKKKNTICEKCGYEKPLNGDHHCWS